jgi:hypothetical protein
VCYEHVCSLVERAKEFETKLVNIVVVCKGSRAGPFCFVFMKNSPIKQCNFCICLMHICDYLGGLKWMKLAGVTFPLLADEKGDFVKFFHFGADVFNLCNTTLYNMVTILTKWLIFEI